MPKLDFSPIFSADYFPLLASGLKMTLLLFAAGWVFSMLLGMVLTLVRGIPFRPLGWLVAAYVEYQRNIPLLVHLFIWYFGVPQALPHWLNDWINQQNAEAFFAIVAIACYNAAYISEDMRSGLRAIPRVQFEAARAIGFTFVGAMRWIILPQAFRNALPALISQTLIIFKGTSLAAVIGVAELTYQARLIESETFRVFETFSVITIVYLAGTLPLMALGHHVERRGKTRSRA